MNFERKCRNSLTSTFDELKNAAGTMRFRLFVLERHMQHGLCRANARDSPPGEEDPVNHFGAASARGSSVETAVTHGPDKERNCGRRRVILCVDDDPVVLYLQHALLKSAGFSVRCANNSSLALHEFCKSLPDAVVLDYEMPGTTGAALAARLRRICKEVPLLLSSGSMQVPDREAALFDRVLPKGLAPAMLIGVLSEMFPVFSASSPSSVEHRCFAGTSAIR